MKPLSCSTCLVVPVFCMLCCNACSQLVETGRHEPRHVYTVDTTYGMCAYGMCCGAFV